MPNNYGTLTTTPSRGAATLCTSPNRGSAPHRLSTPVQHLCHDRNSKPHESGTSRDWPNLLCPKHDVVTTPRVDTAPTNSSSASHRDGGLSPIAAGRPRPHAGHHQGHPMYAEDLTPEDIFNMFFGFPPGGQRRRPQPQQGHEPQGQVKCSLSNSL